MQINVKVRPYMDGDAAPPELAGSIRSCSESVVRLMQLHGILELVAQPVPSWGREMLSKDYLPIALPEPGLSAMGAIQEAAASALCEYISLFGITQIVLLASAEEQQVIVAAMLDRAKEVLEEPDGDDPDPPTPAE